MKKQVFVMLIIMLCSSVFALSVKTYTRGKQVRYLVSTPSGMMDIAATSVADANSIAVGLVAAQAAQAVAEEQAEIERAVKLVASSDLTKVDKTVLQAAETKLSAEIVKEVEVINVTK